MRVWLRIVIAVLLAAALAVSSWAGDAFFLPACVLLVLCVAVGWPSLAESRHPKTTVGMVAVIGLLGLASVRLTPSTTLIWLSVLAALGLLATFVAQLVLGPSERGLTVLIASQMTGIVIVLAGCAWLAGVETPARSAGVIVGAVATAFALAATMVPWPAVYTSPLAVLAGAASAAGTTEIAGAADSGTAIPLWVGIVLGAVLGVLVAAVHRLFGMNRPTKRSARGGLGRRSHRAGSSLVTVELGLGSVPIALGGALVYITERLFIG
ncbi:hypothetical protein [Spelaeicoccus albus]|uniref:Uncharacterized protein n=1 Tax=Spelaeicoccus albus TaxID=1280376 RepID=A0A7Z0A9W4_9MICO|nr:hypothetical protein [Spelaeicoccus albus]NYI66035.1 hypothetical protein [Spelaeicoccus albus]